MTEPDSRNTDDASANPWPLIDAMKRGLRREGLTYAQLALRMDLSEASIKRMFSSGRLSLHQVLQVCDAIGADLGELGRSAQARAQTSRQLSVAQERVLAEDPRLLMLFHFLVAGRSLADIGNEYGLQGTERTLLLARLDKLGMIELLPRDRVRLRVPRDFTWRSNGPIRRRYGAQVLREFLLDGFDGERSMLRFEVRELSESSIQVIRRKLERLALEATELAELDAPLPTERKRSVGMAVAMRPWVFSIATALRNTAQPAPASGRKRR